MWLLEALAFLFVDSLVAVAVLVESLIDGLEGRRLLLLLFLKLLNSVLRVRNGDGVAVELEICKWLGALAMLTVGAFTKEGGVGVEVLVFKEVIETLE